MGLNSLGPYAKKIKLLKYKGDDFKCRCTIHGSKNTCFGGCVLSNFIALMRCSLFLRLFCRMRNRSLVSEREFTRLVVRSVGRSLSSELLFVFPLTNAQLHLFGKCET